MMYDVGGSSARAAGSSAPASSRWRSVGLLVVSRQRCGAAQHCSHDLVGTARRADRHRREQQVAPAITTAPLGDAVGRAVARHDALLVRLTRRLAEPVARIAVRVLITGRLLETRRALLPAL